MDQSIHNKIEVILHSFYKIEEVLDKTFTVQREDYCDPHKDNNYTNVTLVRAWFTCHTLSSSYSSIHDIT